MKTRIKFKSLKDLISTLTNNEVKWLNQIYYAYPTEYPKYDYYTCSYTWRKTYDASGHSMPQSNFFELKNARCACYFARAMGGVGIAYGCAIPFDCIVGTTRYEARKQFVKAMQILTDYEMARRDGADNLPSLVSLGVM